MAWWAAQRGLRPQASADAQFQGAQNGASPHADEDGWADVGHGVIDWPSLYGQLQKTPATWYVMEHDKPNDVARFARRSLATVQTFAG
ncbi:MAG: hypothetical protein ACO30K_13910 [bacterium]